MKKFLLGGLLILVCSIAFVQAYLPRTVDSKLVGLMLDNIEQLIASKGDWVADVAVATLYDRLDWELDARKRYIMGEVIDRLSIEYAIPLQQDREDENVIIKEDIINTDLDSRDKGVVIDIPELSNDQVGGKDQLVDVTYFGVEDTTSVASSQATMNITTYWTPVGGDCDSLVQHVQAVPREPAYLSTTLTALLQGPQGPDAGSFAGVSDRDVSGYLQSVALVDGVAFIDFDADVLPLLTDCAGDQAQPLRLLDATVLGVNGINKVIYALDGSVSDFYMGLDSVATLDSSLSDLQKAFDTKKFISEEQRALDSRGRRLYSSAYGVYANDLMEGELTNYRVCGHGHGLCLTVIERDADHRVEKSGCTVASYRMNRAACDDEYVTMIDDRQLVVTGLSGWDDYAFNEFMRSIAIK